MQAKPEKKRIGYLDPVFLSFKFQCGGELEFKPAKDDVVELRGKNNFFSAQAISRR
jgi:hypothetical protein